MRSELKGIVRANKRVTTENIPCNEVINMRFRDGKWKPILSKQVDSTLPFVATAVVKHVLETGTLTIFYRPDTGVVGYYVYNIGATTITTLAAGLEVDLKIMGNILIINDLTTGETTFAVYNYDISAYKIIDSLFPEIPKLTIENGTGTGSYTYNVAGTAQEAWEAYLEHVNDQMDRGVLLGKRIVFWAWELFDGSYIRPSAPTFIELGYAQGDNSYQIGIDLSISNNIVTLASSVTSIKNDYKGLIKGLAFFSCQQHEKYDSLWYNYVGAGYTEILTIAGTATEPGVDDMLREDILFYKIGEIDFTALVDGANTVSFNTCNIDGTQEAFPVDSFSHHQISGHTSYVYNNRLILGNINGTLFKGFDSDVHLNSDLSGAPSYSQGAAFNVRIVVYLDTISGQKVVISDTVAMDWYYLGDIMVLTNRVLSYPDARASKMQIQVYSSGSWMTYIEVVLKSHAYQNFAYYAAAVVRSVSNIYPSETPAVEVNTYQDLNRVQASEIANPFVYPAVNSYQVGTGEILGIITNAMQVNDGQFGEYPLVVFTKSGVWSLLVGMDVFISNIVPLNPDVAYPSTIAKVNRMIIYGTKEGLKILNGSDAIDISAPLKGDPGEYLNADDDFLLFINHGNLVEITERSYVDFLTYLTAAACSFDMLNEEIIVSNPNRFYSYLYSLESKQWFKTTDTFYKFVPGFEVNYGLIYGTNSTSIRDMSQESGTFARVLIESNPLNFNSESFKKIDRLAIRGEFQASTGKYIGFYLYGSLDGIIYKLVSIKQPLKRFNDLILASGYSCKYFILVIAGEMLADSFINFVEVQLREKYQGKLR